MTAQSGHIPRGSSAVMARRIEPPDSLDWFPTPPWATRALLELVLFERLEGDASPMVVRRPVGRDEPGPDSGEHHPFDGMILVGDNAESSLSANDIVASSLANGSI